MTARFVPRKYDKAYKAALDSGWRVEYTGGGHIKWCPPVGAAIYTSSSPSDRRAVKNVLSMLRRSGLRVR